MGDVEAERARLSAQVADTRAELLTTFDELRGVMREQVDWRSWVARNPLLTVAVVAAIGFRIGRGSWA